MENDPLQQLRDIHLPPDPGWWPPSFGWWVLALAAATLLAWGVWSAIRYYQARRPLRLARSHLAGLQSAYSAGEMSALEFVHACNELLKRLLVRAMDRGEYAVMTGTDWLAALDELGGNRFFSEGHGQVLGNERFQIAPLIDADALHQGISDLIEQDLVKRFKALENNTFAYGWTNGGQRGD